MRMASLMTTTMMMMIAATLLTTSAMANAAEKMKPMIGPYETEHKIFKNVEQMDSSDRTVDVYYPKNQDRQYPLLVYLHGMGGGNFIEPIAYFELFPAIARFGYVLVAPRACNVRIVSPSLFQFDSDFSSN